MAQRTKGRAKPLTAKPWRQRKARRDLAGALLRSGETARARRLRLAAREERRALAAAGQRRPHLMSSRLAWAAANRARMRARERARARRAAARPAASEAKRKGPDESP